MLGLNPLLPLLAVLAGALLARLTGRGGDRASGRAGRLDSLLERAADHRWAPLAAGVLTGAATWFAWGSLARSGVVHDEVAYLLQAELFARLRWAAASPPLPQFFEQIYVLVQPSLASKYPPGTSLLIAPGMLVGLPGLPIVLMNALTGTLLFALARHVSNGVTAALAWMIWITSFPVLYFHAMYLSEVPSGLAVLAAWWSFVWWRREQRTRHLAIGAAAVALCMIARPLTGLALAVSLAVAFVATFRHGVARPRVRPLLAAALVAGTATAALLATWSWRTTGDPRVAPITLYTRTYVPFDRLGFGAREDEQPSTRLPWDQRVTSDAFYREHRTHTLDALPGIAVRRLQAIARDMWYEWRGGLAVVAALGLLGGPAALWVGIGAFALHFALYLLYAHPPQWSLYYLEWTPLLAFVTAVGAMRVFAWLAPSPGGVARRALPASLLLAALVVPGVRTLHLVRAQIAQDHAYYDSFARLLPRTPRGAIVFVRYARGHNDGLSLIRNSPELAAAPVWTVYDRGAENDRLRALAPERDAFLFDEATWTLRPLPALADARSGR